MRRVDGLLALAGLAFLIAPFLPAGVDRAYLPGSFGDLVAYHYPMRHLVASSLQAGRLPFWNPHLFAGLPLSSNPQAALFYPPAFLGWLFPLSLALSWDGWLHLFLAALGAALLARRGGLSALAAWSLGFAYALCPFVAYRVDQGIPTLLASLAWAPWCWLAWSSGVLGLLGLAFALQLFSGHPQFFLVNASGLGLWTALRAPRRLPALAFEAAVAAVLSPVLWSPLLEFLGQSVRRSWPPQFSLGYSAGWRELATWVWPGALGDPIAGTWPDVPSVFFETTGVCLGAPLALLAPLGLTPATTALLLVGLFLAAGAHNPVYPWLLAHTPMGLLRTPSRALFLALWALWLSAAGAWRRLSPRPGARYVLAAASALALAQLYVWDARFTRGVDARPFLSVNKGLAQKIGGAPFRLLGDPGLANPNKVMLYRAMNVNGYEAFYLAGYPAYAFRSEGKPAADPSRTYLSRADTPEMRRLGVAYRLGLDGRLTRASPRPSLPLAYFVDERGEPVGAPPALSRPRPERWELAGAWPEGSAGVVLAQSLYPGWRAWLNGREVPLGRVDGLLQGVARRDGPMSIVARYEPSRWGALIAVALAGWSVCLAAAARRFA